MSVPYLFSVKKKKTAISTLSKSEYSIPHSDAVHFDAPYNILESEEWEHQIESVELQTILNQASVSQKPLNHPNTVMFWHKPEDTHIVMDAFRKCNYQELTTIYWHKPGHTSAAQARDYVKSVEMATMGFFPSRRAVYVNHSSNPRERHNHLDIPHVTHFVKDADGKRVNPAEKPPELAQHFCEHHIPAGGTILIIGAGAGGSVFGALRSGVNVVAVESDEFQFNIFPSTYMAKEQVEIDRIAASEEEEEEVAPTQQADTVSDDAATTSNLVARQNSQEHGNCDACGQPLKADDVTVGATCEACEGLKGTICESCRVPHPTEADKWLCTVHHQEHLPASVEF